ncbi:hypothetical protein [Microbacterium indicum]|uniref:hypothetical protein n=1 Tax=Microbacterium indicum TaxID=358100 RepID=UPI00048D875E|nr:hypothetical protein [Microbacterium indicum]
MSDAPAPTRSRRMTGIGTVLVFAYGVMALAATGRSFVSIAEHFSAAPVPYLLSALAAVVYILATIALFCSKSVVWYRIAWVSVIIELTGVLVVGTLSWAVPELFHADNAVWSWYGGGTGEDGHYGYFWVPLVLPFLGIWWLTKHDPRAAQAEQPA